MLQHAIFPVLFIFLFFIPLISMFFSPFLVLFIGKNSELGRTQFQNKLILWLGLAIVISTLGKLGYLGTSIPSPQMADDGNIIINRVNISFISTAFIPGILFSICVRSAAKRLKGMGYNRFLSLLALLPFIGPMLLIWLAFTIRERKLPTSIKISN